MIQEVIQGERPRVRLLAYIALVLVSAPFTPRVTTLFEGSPAGRAVLVAVPLLAVAAVMTAAGVGAGGDPRRYVVAWAAIVLLYLLVWITLCERAIEGIHLAQYSLLSMLAFRAMHGPMSLPAAYSLSAALTVMVSWVNELLQAVLPNRVYDPRDVALDAIAGALGLASVWQAERH